MSTVFDEERAGHAWALVVDDSQIARFVLSRHLTRLGFDVELAASAEAALDRLTGPLPDVVFMDHLLPDMDGFEAVRRLRAQPHSRALPIVMYTSEESPSLKAMALEAGANGIFLKTSSSGALGDILRALNVLPAPAATRRVGSRALASRASATDAPVWPSAVDRRLTQLLEHAVERRNAELRQELLAEFAILESHEERMRAVLYAEVDARTRQAVDRIDYSVAERRRDMLDERRRATRRAWGLLAVVVAGFCATFAVGWNTAQLVERLRAETNVSRAALQTQSDALSALEAQIAATRSAAERAAALGLVPALPITSEPGEPAESPSPVRSLV